MSKFIKPRYEYKQREFIEYIYDNKSGIAYILTNGNDMNDLIHLLNKQEQVSVEFKEQLKNAIVPKFKQGDYLYSVEKSGSQILLAEGYVTTITQLDDGSIWYHLSVKPHEFGVREATCYKTMDEVHEVSQKLLKEIDDEQNNRKS